MTALPVSVIIVSRGRPDALVRCVAGVARQDHPRFEIVVVADPAGLAAVAGWGGRIKTRGFDLPNIAEARNAGIALAAGAVVAFVDDDAVPEPTWLTRLVAPLGGTDVAAAGGTVLGRNGISLQWGPSAVDRLGRRLDLQVAGAGVSIHRGSAGLGIKTEGTNMAFRRDVLVRIGGFDPRFAFYLDESDVNLRLGARGARVAVVPGAVVHHGFAPSDRRRGDRVPRDLSQIGTSLAAFLRKHGTDPVTRLAEERAAQRRRLVAHMVAGRIEPRDVGRLMEGFVAGWARGATLDDVAVGLPEEAEAGFLPFEGVRTGRHIVLAGRRTEARALRGEAARRAAEGDTVTLILLSRTALFHRVAFRAEGYWEQVGGLYGRSVRTDPLFRAWRFGARVAREVERVRGVREGAVSP